MTTITLSGNRIEMVIDGKIDSGQMETLVTEFLEKAAGLETIELLYIDQDFRLPTLGAMAVKLSHFTHLFKVAKKIRRAALLTDKGWLRKAAQLENVLIPWIEIKTFDTNAREQAGAWLAGEAQ